MIGYKWTTDTMQAFFDGHQFHFGWNEQDGVKDGIVCKEGGFHITTDPSQPACATGSKFEPNGERVQHCYKVYYRKKDILGKEGFKLRLKAFKILKKKPHEIGTMTTRITANIRYNGPYITSSSADTSANANVGWSGSFALYPTA